MSATEKRLIRYEVITLRGSFWRSESVDVLFESSNFTLSGIYSWGGSHAGFLLVRRLVVKEETTDGAG